jgi:hypothetical protein
LPLAKAELKIRNYLTTFWNTLLQNALADNKGENCDPKATILSGNLDTHM